MKVKARKVGNSMVLTVPNKVAERVAMYNGQEFDVEVYNGEIVEFKPVRGKGKRIDWNKYSALRDLNMTNGVDPAEYISNMREDRD